MNMNSPGRLRLNLDPDAIAACHESAQAIAEKVWKELEGLSTVAVERAVARLFGIDGVDSAGSPLPNVVVDALSRSGGLEDGVAIHLAKACLETGGEPQDVAEAVAGGRLDLASIPDRSRQEAEAKARELARRAIERILTRRREREELISRLGQSRQPWLYVIVATGNIYEDVVQARMAASQGADIIAVIRSTGQSLMDFVPYGPTTEGYGGTYATQENFRLMRKALDEESEKLGRYIRLVNYCSGLCMPEIATMGAFERLDVMLNDAMYGILFRDINMERTLIDQRFSRMINGLSGIIINTGEDNYLTTVDAFHHGPQVLASEFINLHFARMAGIPDEQIGLGHAFQIDPWLESSLLYEIAMALLVRQCFPSCPVKYMPPTVHKDGNIFFAHALDTMYNLVACLTGQSIHLVGMLTEAVHTPFLHDRFLSIQSAKYVREASRGLSDNLSLVPGELVEKRAQSLLLSAKEVLERVKHVGLFAAIEEGVFAGVKRDRHGGRGREGVFKKSARYFNPFDEILSGRDRHSREFLVE